MSMPKNQVLGRTLQRNTAQP